MYRKSSIILLFLLLLVFSCNKKSDQADPAITEAIMEFMEGEVSINDKKAETGEKIENKSIVSTGENSFCEIVFDNKNIIKIQDNTLFKLDFSKVHKSIDLKQGTLISVLKKLAVLADSDSFTITTPAAILGVRGTSFFVKADPVATYICICNGIVTVSDAENNSSEIIKSKHHSGRLFTALATPTTQIKRSRK
ncbi:MAG: FecR domain-containing protein [Spirochaetales bacterium]|nr:FecR domain-containing protein [Spirochaetales bacterium]